MEPCQMPKPIRPIRIEGNIAYVPLTRGYEAAIDAQFAEDVGQWNWCAYEKSNTVYAVRNKAKNAGLVRMHRYIMSAPDGFEVDHIDGNGLNNTTSNLRICNRFENMRNRGPHNGKSTKGISWHKKSGKWQARICAGNGQTYLGLYETREMAQNAYNEACEEMHGSFAVTI
jgi:hypothetical protein